MASTASTIDVDFRPQKATAELVAPYLGRAWRELLRLGEHRGEFTAAWGLPDTMYRAPGKPVATKRTQNREVVYGGAGATPAEIAERHAAARDAAAAELDRAGVALAVLNPGTAGNISGVGHPHLAAELARATNEWTIGEWLPADPRYRASIVVSAHDPGLAAKEIRRCSSVPRVVQVVLAHPPTPLGNRFLHPILAAAEECGLTLCLETGGAFTGRNRGVNAIGVPSTRFEYELSWPSAAQAHLLSVVAEGVPERFPELRILLDGFGAAWLPSLLWGMDRAHDRETAPPRRTSRVAPSDELRALVRFTTARLELPADVHQLVGLLGLVGAERLLVFGSGADADGSGRDAVALLPDAWRERVLRTNADELYRRALVLA